MGQVRPPSVEASQRMIFPVYPLSVRTPELLPEQTVVAPLNVPGTVKGSTVIVTVFEN